MREQHQKRDIALRAAGWVVELRLLRQECIICDKSISLYCGALKAGLGRREANETLFTRGLQNAFPLKSRATPICALALSFSFHSSAARRRTKFTLGKERERASLSCGRWRLTRNKSARNHSGQRGLQTYFPHHIKRAAMRAIFCALLLCEPNRVSSATSTTTLISASTAHTTQTKMNREWDIFAFACSVV